MYFNTNSILKLQLFSFIFIIDATLCVLKLKENVSNRKGQLSFLL